MVDVKEVLDGCVEGRVGLLRGSQLFTYWGVDRLHMLTASIKKDNCDRCPRSRTCRDRNEEIRTTPEQVCTPDAYLLSPETGYARYVTWKGPLVQCTTKELLDVCFIF